MNTIFFILNLQPNPRFVKQINYLSKTGYTVFVFYFYRDTMVDYTCNINPNVKLVKLGRIDNQKYFKRIFTIITSLKFYKKTDNLPVPKSIMVDNIFSLFLALSYRKKKKIKILLQVADLRELIFAKNLIGIFYRFLEKTLVKNYIDTIVVTSIKYYDYFYSSFFERNKIFLLENKPLSSDLPIINHNNLSFNKRDKIGIGLIGGLNRGRTTKLLLDIVKDDPNLFLNVHGLGEDETIVKQYSNNYANIHFYGKFNFFNDISSLYSEIDIVYVVYDTYQESLNNRIALPNKLYEAIYFRKPLIVSKDTYLAEIIEKYGIGIAANSNSTDDIKTAIYEVNKNFDYYLTNFNKIGINEYIADNDYELYEKIFR